jgi:hypothetical protein
MLSQQQQNSVSFSLQTLLVARVYYPQKAHDGERSKTPMSAIRYSQEIHVLGGQTLAELRDVIACTADCTVIGDVSADAVNSKAKKKVWPKAGDVYRSGFFFIGDCFYNDFR